MTRRIVWLPLAIFAILVGFVARELSRPTDRTVRSTLIGQPLPRFALPALLPGRPGVRSDDFRRGGPRLVNVFASWCVPCIAEAPQLMRLKALGVPIDAIAIRDTPAGVADFLSRHGDPYAGVGDDPESGVQLALGSSGVPETFVIDRDGRIAMQHVGDIRAEDVAVILAAWRAAR